MLPGLELLAKRMKEYRIPEWPGAANFERILVYRIPDEASARDTFVKDGHIIKPDDVRDLQKWRSPMGVIVSAGLRAMDILYDHGMKLGELVWISPHVMTRFEFEKDKEGRPVEFFFMNVDDAIISVDVDERVATGELVLVRDPKTGKHHYARKGEKDIYERTDPATFQDAI